MASSPIEKRVAFLQSKNLTQEEVDLALSRVGEDPASAAAAVSSAPSSQGYNSQQVAYRPLPQSAQGYGYPPYGQWQPPPEYVQQRNNRYQPPRLIIRQAAEARLEGLVYYGDCDGWRGLWNVLCRKGLFLKRSRVISDAELMSSATSLH